MRNFLAFLIVECDDFFLNGDLETWQGGCSESCEIFDLD